ncbi:TM0106 family RecB-like putative nuclease [Arthrobacter crusticola]|uniref:TM0106 family RecB-like putative nuclease n=1 Tax=Arthrobacter crusticola TaxID=2547960 RepID=A0A4R5TZ27_9MICC|nr:bifunctional RecB family nuclease/DEAD/DEAH box helicase [Arthrobacter crusticola]TDK26485.1 TM0106 family RecB-like putative nuclease [Arthrobacter crusticola]
MFLLENAAPDAGADLVFSASDLVNAAECEYRVLRILDEKLGRTPPAKFTADEMLQRAAALGDVHEHRVLEKFTAELGTYSPGNPGGVYEVVPAATMDRATLTAKHEESLGALRAGAGVVFQASFFDGVFHGRSDFLVHTDGGYAVWDTKLARHAKVGALLQLAAYGDQLLRAGLTPAPQVTLVLGDGTSSVHSLDDLIPVYRERRARFLDLLAAHRAQPDPVEWDGPGHTACGRCDYCQQMVESTRDVLLVANLSLAQRADLRKAGISTIDQLAASEAPGGSPALARLRDQARMQTGLERPDGGVNYTGADGTSRRLAYKVLPGHALGLLPPPDQGDIFFDFEGDPLWQDPGTGSWGIEYLFGVVENARDAGSKPPFRAFWAHSRAEERTAFSSFLDYVAERRARYPALHIYHYAAYEKSALRRLSMTHVLGEDAVDTLLREGVLIDLYDVVRRSLRISEKSYSIKALEPLYMGADLRTGAITDAGASVVAYSEYCAARDAGDDARAAELIAGIRDYNEYDCRSTLHLRNWLLERAGERGIGPASASPPERERTASEPQPEEAHLLRYVGSLPAAAQGPDDRAVAMVAAAVGYHRRERKQFWWEHFDRLGTPPESWTQARDMFLPESVEVETDWALRTPRARSLSRTLRLTGVLPEGSDFRRDSTWFSMYEEPLPDGVDSSDSGRGGWFGAKVLTAGTDAGKDVILLEERLRAGAPAHPFLPVALAPDQPIRTPSIEAALLAVAAEVGSTLPDLPRGPGLDLLRRTPPRLTSGVLPPALPGPTGYVDAITAAVERLDSSYLAVQGPPGTGKTFVGAAVITQLVARGWKVGVVAQSHAVVENLLGAALRAGVPPERVAKKTADPAAPWPNTTDDGVAALLDEDAGCLIGGTAWTMTGTKVPAGSLDLLVIDEAGQFSLANTLAVARSARRLLLLGDPQQLPQVTQGSHPEPVHESALGWLSDGHATLPEWFGYFLADSWRMHPALCAFVSRLSYDRRLESTPSAALRHLDGLAAGVECVMVEHTERRSTSSPEEAAEVLAQVERHLGRGWTSGDGTGARPLGEGDLLVVAAYNAQVQLIRTTLDDAGYRRVRVGTVDKFQGQEAAVVIVSMACSSAAEAPRGIEFLLSRNRINVAVSRGQWRAVIVRAPGLTDHVPPRPQALEELGAFIGLCAGGA